MKHKLFLSLLLLSLLLSQSGSAFAQEPLPPRPSGDAATFSKSEAGLSLKAGDSQQPLSLQSGELVTATTPLVNGDFEQGRFVGWTEFSTHGYPLVLSSPTDLPIPAHSGGWGVWLGGDVSEVSAISQNITIISPTTLRLWYLIGSQEPTCGQDVGYVKLDATIIQTWNLCESTDMSGWAALDLNLNAYNGQTVTLNIQAITNNDVDNSNLFIDDVSLYQTFADVAYGYWAESYIQRLYSAGVTGGCGTSPLIYCPGTAVTRDQMAVFLLKGKYGTSYLPPAVGSSTGFNDVPTTHWAAAWIKQLAVEGITGGCGAGNYCPGTAVTRDQMAVFLLKSKYGSSHVPPAATGVFSDVPVTHWAAAWIEELAAEGITGGCGTGTYCPGTAVTRDQMAVFLVRAFSLP
jgi:hypothetical protein